MAQTTFNLKKFEKIKNRIQKILQGNEIIVKKTICNATEVRQKETAEISKKVECMIIVGDKKSSNTNKLYDISKENCKTVFFIREAKELPIEEILKYNKIGIMAGASTPYIDIENVVNQLKDKKERIHKK